MEPVSKEPCMEGFQLDNIRIFVHGGNNYLWIDEHKITHHSCDSYYPSLPPSRWLLLDFKREYPFEESIRLYEVLCSHYLELNSDKARVETDKVIAKEFELDGKY